LQILCNIEWMLKKITDRPFQEALSDINLVSKKDVDIRLVEAILSRSLFLPENPHMFQLELLSRFSRAPGANSPVIGRMVAEAAAMVLVTSEQCIVPFYPCVSPSSGGVRRHTRYAPTHVLAVTTEKLHRKQQLKQEEEEEEQEVAVTEEEYEEEEEEKEKEKEAAEDKAAENKYEEEYQKEEEEEEEEEEEQEEQEQEEEEEEKEYEQEQEEKEEEVKTKKSYNDLTTLAVVWGERCGLQVWRTGLDNYTLQPLYHISDEVCCLMYLKTDVR